MITKEQKLLYFQYVLHNLLIWHKDVKGSEESNDISILKALKLLFFISACKTSIDNSNDIIDNVFDKFYAMPYGHVESDIYTQIKDKHGVLEYFTIDNSKTFRNTNDISELIKKLDTAITDKIDNSILFLKENHPRLIQLKAFDLVELSHSWFSWRKNYKKALQAGNKRQEIPSSDIKVDTKVYSLQNSL